MPNFVLTPLALQVIDLQLALDCEPVSIHIVGPDTIHHEILDRQT